MFHPPPTGGAGCPSCLGSEGGATGWTGVVPGLNAVGPVSNGMVPIIIGIRALRFLWTPPTTASTLQTGQIRFSVHHSYQNN